ncbi:hypothetical protein Gorai_024016 [Gossypium raimondii]|uniref:Uncharacterized protein n=1 Tax=Gossypium raimondii TaxID=29730 RepID=A0A0D2QMU5_GOSRA|nr:hypothetical protein B456_003G036000 [Gossypium raimondii]KJB18152.1 hypothetical protein B456_003G036000 [Gossypium raimondii]MBA0581850.1 hypothetical protein [Gossypium raimondii]
MLLQSFLRRQPPSSPLESSPISSLSASPTMVGFISYESSKCCGFEQALTLASDWKCSVFSYCSSRPQIPPSNSIEQLQDQPTNTMFWTL